MSKSRPQSADAKKSGCSCLSMRSLGFLAIFLALFSALYSFLDARLEQFYIFEPGHLHDLSQRAIAAHGDNTRGVVDYIVAELDQKVPSQYVNKEEEWVFNNAGGAMGAMYIIHASTCLLFSFLFQCARGGACYPWRACPWNQRRCPLDQVRQSPANRPCPGITEYLIIFGEFSLVSLWNSS